MLEVAKLKIEDVIECANYTDVDAIKITLKNNKSYIMFVGQEALDIYFPSWDMTTYYMGKNAREVVGQIIDSKLHVDDVLLPAT